MPLYTYRCPFCGQEREEKHAMTDTPVIGCNMCGASMRVKPQSTPFRFRGPGGENDLRTRTTRP